MLFNCGTNTIFAETVEHGPFPSIVMLSDIQGHNLVLVIGTFVLGQLMGFLFCFFNVLTKHIHLWLLTFWTP